MTPPYLDPPEPAPSPIPASGPMRTGVPRLRGGQVALVLAAAIGGTIVLTLAGSLMAAKLSEWPASSPQMLLLGLAIQPAALLCACYALVVQRWGLSWRDLGVTGADTK